MYLEVTWNTEKHDHSAAVSDVKLYKQIIKQNHLNSLFKSNRMVTGDR